MRIYQEQTYKKKVKQKKNGEKNLNGKARPVEKKTYKLTINNRKCKKSKTEKKQKLTEIGTKLKKKSSSGIAKKDVQKKKK